MTYMTFSIDILSMNQQNKQGVRVKDLHSMISNQKTQFSFSATHCFLLSAIVCVCFSYEENSFTENKEIIKKRKKKKKEKEIKKMEEILVS